MLPALSAMLVLAAPPTYDATVIGPPDKFGSARPRAMTAGGIVVGQASSVEDEYPIRAIVSDGGMPDILPVVIHDPEIAYDANDDGIVVGISNFAAVAWKDGTPVALGTEFELLDGNPIAGGFGWANDINTQGLIVGYVDVGFFNETQCVYWPDVDSAPIILDGLGDPYSYGSALGVNDAAMIAGVVQENVGGIILPAFWPTPEVEAILINLPDGYINGEAVALNEIGDVVGRIGNGVDVVPFLYDATTEKLKLLGHLDGADLLFAEARDVNDDQMVVGTSNAGPGVAHAFLWDDGTMHDLNDLVEPIDGVLHLSDAVTILDDGRILAEGLVDDTPGFIIKTMVVLTPQCSADVNGDGELNILDFVAFQALFVAGDLEADCNQDGSLSILDFVCFQQVFVKGCA